MKKLFIFLTLLLDCAQAQTKAGLTTLSAKAMEGYTTVYDTIAGKNTTCPNLMKASCNTISNIILAKNGIVFVKFVPSVATRPVTTYRNTAQICTAICSTGFTGSNVVVISKRAYTSTLSQLDTNNKAPAAATQQAKAWLKYVDNPAPLDSVTSKRNYEVEVQMQSGIVMLRRQPNGSAVVFEFIGNGTGRFLADVGGTRAYNNLDENVIAKLKGWPNGKFTFGVDGFDYYAKYNGKEFFRKKQYEVLGEGPAAIKPIYEATITPLTPVYLKESITDKAALDSNILRAEKLGFKEGFVRGNVAGTTIMLSGADTARVKVGDLMYIEPTERRRGIVGPGGAWPNAGVKTVADLKNYTGSTFTWVHESGLTYEKYADGWWSKQNDPANPVYYNSNYYIDHAFPVGLRIRVTGKVGNKITTDAPTAIAVTNARIFWDNEELWNGLFGWGQKVASTGLKLRFKKGLYFFGDYPQLTNWQNFSLLGDNYETVFTACVGSAAIMLNINRCDNFKMRGIKLQSNVGLDGWGMRQYPRRLGGNHIDPNFDTGAGGLLIGNQSNSVVEVEVADTYTGGLVMSNSIGGKFKVKYSHRTGVKRYNAWGIVTTDGSVDNVITGSFSSPTQFGAFESYGGRRNKFIKLVSTNGYLSSNTSEEMHIDGLQLTYTKNSRVPGQDFSDPSINFNLNTGRADAKFGGSVKNTTIHFEDFIDTIGNYKRGIVVQEGYNNAVIENVTITYAKPWVNNGRARIGHVGIASNGENTTVINSKCFGLNAGGHPNTANISITDGMLINCEADVLFIKSGVIKGCKAREIWHGPNVVFEGTNTGKRILWPH